MTPILISTWSFGKTANAAGWPVLTGPSPDPLGAVEAACRAVEDDPHCRTVGRGGLPDRSGRVSLDAAVMVSPARCGAVGCVQYTAHAVTLARAVMEQTPHSLLVGDGADQFARQIGMTRDELLSESARKLYEQWLKRFGDRPDDPRSFGPVRNIEETMNGSLHDDEAAHDTVCVLGIDARGKLAGAASTSGWPFKLPGRLGDTPIIGHGLYVDPQVGAVCCTGSGELVAGLCGAFLAVENMRRGDTPLDALTGVLQRVIEAHDLHDDHQLGMIALRADARFATASLRPGYQTAIRSPRADKLIKPHRVMLE